MSHTLTNRAQALRQLMEGFIQERLQKKLAADKLTNSSPKYDETINKFQYDYWVSDAADRASKSQPAKNPIKLATHIVKATHPSAIGSNLFVDLKELPNHSLVGSHSIVTIQLI